MTSISASSHTSAPVPPILVTFHAWVPAFETLVWRPIRVSLEHTNPSSLPDRFGIGAGSAIDRPTPSGHFRAKYRTCGPSLATPFARLPRGVLWNSHTYPETIYPRTHPTLAPHLHQDRNGDRRRFYTVHGQLRHELVRQLEAGVPDAPVEKGVHHNDVRLANSKTWLPKNKQVSTTVAIAGVYPCVHPCSEHTAPGDVVRRAMLWQRHADVCHIAPCCSAPHYAKPCRHDATLCHVNPFRMS